MVWLVLAAGLAIIAVTLADVFATILVPGPSTGLLRIGARVGRLTLPLGRALSRWTQGPGHRPSNSFAPLIFLLSFTTWMLLLLLGFALLFLFVRQDFTPALGGIDDALYFAGSSLLTLGVSEVDAHGAARWLILAAALSGFAVISATITFMLQIQSALHQRETRVLSLGSLAGTPPSGLVLLEAVAKLHVDSELRAFFHDWRDWSAGVLHSHLSSPVLIFFHSVDRESDWVAALEAVLDAATLLMVLTEDQATGAATLMHRAGSRTAARLCAMMRIDEGDTSSLDHDAIAGIAARLEQGGFTVRPVDATMVKHLANLRADYAGRIAALARLLGADRPQPLA